jgi:cell division topological specificity factor
MFWGRRRDNTKDTLKNRLQVVLAYDRQGLPPGKQEALRQEMLEVLKRYFPSLRDFNMEMKRDGDGEAMVLTADIPLR